MLATEAQRRRGERVSRRGEAGEEDQTHQVFHLRGLRSIRETISSAGWRTKDQTGFYFPISSGERIARCQWKWPNDPSSATRHTGRNEGHRDAPAGFAVRGSEQAPV